jgi:hypothetical protein
MTGYGWNGRGRAIPTVKLQNAKRGEFAFLPLGAISDHIGLTPAT